MTRPTLGSGAPSEESAAQEIVLVAIGTLIAAVIVAEFLAPLGIAVWVFYALPLVLCLFTRLPMLPIVVAAFGTVATIVLSFYDPFGGQPVVEPWIGLTNRGMYVVTLWPIAFMVRQLMLARLAREREAWLRRSQAALLESLQGDRPVQEVAQLALAGSANAISAQVGALYAADSSGELRRVGAHALDADETPASFRWGEGLIGRVANDGRLTVLPAVPHGFFRIQAGVGAGPPNSATIAPLRFEGRSVGVLAFGSIGAISDLGREFLDRISEPVGIALVSAQSRARLRELLEESQRQSEELQSQQAELEAQQAEMEATNEELNQTNASMEVQTLELEKQRDYLEHARNEADRASRYKSEFLANMSHELRTPLNSSLILARILADNKEGNLDADQVRSAETIYSAGNDLLVLINDILDLAKIESGRADLEVEDVAVSQVLDSLEKAFRPVAKQKRLAFEATHSSGAPKQIVTDRRRLEQILKNLLSNAFKFTSTGKVELVVLAEAARQIRFSVRDTGIGIASDQQEVIFEAFRQADGTTSRKYGGTGLGLSIARELARLLGGDCEVRSEAGKGSAFDLVVPLVITAGASKIAEQPSPAPKPTAPRATPAVTAAAAVRGAQPPFDDDRGTLARHGRLILAVEDDAKFARILVGLAHELDFDCVVASTAEEGIALARELQPCGILLDVGLPDSSGLSVLERLKRDAKTRHLPIHMISVSDNVQTALELGAVGYALKPVTRDEIISAIQKLEEQHERKLRHVLLVEDDVRQQESIAKLLAGQNAEVIMAAGVSDALDQLEKTSFDCMILDLSLPDGSGHDLLEKMAGGTRYSFPPVIVYTGREIDREDEDRLRRYSRSIILKGARSPERLLDEVTLFLHQVESNLPPEQQRMLAQARQREAVFEGRRILVVEDDVRNVFALSRVLEPRGAKIEIARNGREALDALQRIPDVDLVLMDLMMPEMDGLTAIREIRKVEAFKRLPVIALTAKAMPDDREQAMFAGANDYMAKPFDVDKLVSLCRVWLPR